MQNDSNLRLNKFYLITFFILFFFKAQSQEINCKEYRSFEPCMKDLQCTYH